ncbi:hypothetical protein MTBLM5_430021 [Magnetospirillum sp. LM-5]|uniref:hypothetical protein n=1 Tax=Magnetospirillum sp. LM-5 TaxID=2681466 RepID=UPI0013811128|nr:hypothetical protein [Magnetospirillum sp. LM-5]CAA7622083.1 hypothetical protein MTBLM5_430021 [Magnetospirillum sp. LM-5]
MSIKTFVDRLLHRPADAEPKGVRDQAASTEAAPDSLAQLESRFRHLFSGTSTVSLVEGHLFMLSLADIAKACGKRWHSVAGHAHTLAEGIFRDRLGKTDVFVRYDDTTYLLAFSQLGMEAATIRALALAQMLSTLLMGSQPGAAVQVLRAVRGKGEDIHFEPVRQPTLTTPNGIHHAPKPGDAMLPPDLNFVFRPLLTAKTMVLSTFHCIPTAPRHSDGFKSGYELAPDGPAILALDRAVLRRVAYELSRLGNENSFGLLSLPVHYESLATASRRRDFAALCTAEFGPAGGQRVIFELAGLPVGVPQSQLLELVASLRPYSKAVLARLPPDQTALPAFRQAGIHAVGIDIYAAAEPEDVLFPKLDSFVAAAAQAGLKTYCHGIRTLSLYSAAIAAGFDYVDGHAITMAVEAPKKALHYPLDLPFRQKLGRKKP